MINLKKEKRSTKCSAILAQEFSRHSLDVIVLSEVCPEMEQFKEFTLLKL